MSNNIVQFNEEIIKGQIVNVNEYLSQALANI